MNEKQSDNWEGQGLIPNASNLFWKSDSYLLGFCLVTLKFSVYLYLSWS